MITRVRRLYRNMGWYQATGILFPVVFGMIFIVVVAKSLAVLMAPAYIIPFALVYLAIPPLLPRPALTKRIMRVLWFVIFAIVALYFAGVLPPLALLLMLAVAGAHAGLMFWYNSDPAHDIVAVLRSDAGERFEIRR